MLQQLAPEAELKTVSDGKQAIDYLTRCGNEQLPCAVILDYNMPNMTGAIVLEWLQSRSWFHNIQKFIWSTSQHQVYQEECARNGALHYFSKPNSQEELEDIMHKILEYCELAD